MINNKRFLEIKQAASDGNEKAKMILQAVTSFAPQTDIDNLVNDYYSLPVDDQAEYPNVEENEVIEETPIPEVEVQEIVEPKIDLTEALDKDIDGLIDNVDLEDITFGDFLKNKANSSLREKKNSDYFKMYDLEGRTNYMNNKIDGYNKSFDSKRKDIDRAYRDNSIALGDYANNVNYMLDDDVELSMEGAANAYNDFTGNESAMKSFGRHWDEEDNANVINVLKELVVRYGKKNVIAMLNTLTSDNEGYRDHRNNGIEQEVGRYSKSLEKLLK